MKPVKKIKKGQLLIHPQQGVFKLEEIENREIQGEERAYLVLIPFFKTRRGLKVYIPEDLKDRIGIRRVANKDFILKGLNKAAKFLSEEPVRIVEGSEEKIEEWLRAGAFKKSIILLGRLHYQVKLIKTGKVTDRRLYKKLLRLLSEELAAAKRCTKQYAKKELLGKIHPLLKKKAKGEEK